jgi:hypothetical protein
VTCSGATHPDLEFSYLAGTLVVEPRVVVQAPTWTRAYSAEDPPLVPTYEGLAEGQRPEVEATCSTPAVATSAVGTYPVTCTGAEDPRMTFTYAPGTMEVTPAPVQVEARRVSLLRSLLLGSARFQAVVTSDVTGRPVAGAPVVFASPFTLLGPRIWCQATTDADGKATCAASTLALLLRGPRTFAAIVGGTTNHQPGSASSTFSL